MPAGAASAKLASDLERAAEAATQAGSKSFYFASRFFPAPLRRRAYAIYWFCRTTDDLVDEAPSREQGRRDLDAWEAEFRRGIEGGAIENPILIHFLTIARECGIPPEYPLDLIAGCRMDLEQTRYQDFAELRTFCYRVASTVGLMMCHAIGFQNEADAERGKQHAIDLGIAMQITNILRDVAADREMGRIYLPAEDMAAAGYSEQDLAASQHNENFRTLLRQQAARAQEYYAKAMPGIALLRPEGRFAVEIAARVYSRILDEIEAMDYNVYARRAVVPAVEKYAITFRAIAAAQWAAQWASIWEKTGSGQMQRASAAALVGLVLHFAASYALGWPRLTDVLAEWIMARTPSAWAVPLMDAMGEWAKPFAATGGLAILGFLLWVPQLLGKGLAQALLFAAGVAASVWFGYSHAAGLAAFWLPALAWLYWPRTQKAKPKGEGMTRRELVTSTVMASGTLAVAGEAFLRNRALAAGAVRPVPLYPLVLPARYAEWGDGLVRKPITPLKEFYVMSKNTVDPAPAPETWRLRIQRDGVTLREFSYAELLSMRREERYVSLRCVSNSLKSNLMGTGYWSGLRLEQLVRRSEVPAQTVEMAVIGLDGHGDSFRLDYAFSGEPLFALGMNGETLARNHGFPIRMLSPRYYGFKSIKWIDRIDFVSRPYFGTWPEMGYTKEPVIHPGAFVDRVKKDEAALRAGGIAYSGHGQVEEVRTRLLDAQGQPLGDWQAARLEAPLSAQTFTRWRTDLPPHPQAAYLEARVRDTSGRWQAEKEKPLFPDGVAGPTRKTL